MMVKALCVLIKYMRFHNVYLMKYKYELFEMFKALWNEVNNQLGKIVKAL